MVSPIYPASQLDQPEQLLELLGSFWAHTYQANDFVESMLGARARLDVQADSDFQELLAAMSRFTVPIWHMEEWQVLTLLESERDNSPVSLARYDGTYTYEDDTDLKYGIPRSSGLVTYPLPAALRDVRVIANRIYTSSRVLLAGIDFYLTPGAIHFVTDPFTDDLFPQQEVLQDNVVVDRELNLWLYRSQYEQESLYRQFGYVIELQLASSSNYQALLNALYDSMVEGTSRRALDQALTSVTDVPLTNTADEVVETIAADARFLWILTDKQAYAFKLGSTAIVTVGDVLPIGAAMTETLRVFELNRGEVPEGLRALAMGRGFLGAGFLGELVFVNTTADWEVTTDANGYTRMAFELGGYPSDVEAFWDAVHTRGLAAGQTLANLLDQRETPVGEPGPASLPTTVNPLEFLVQNCLRNNFFVVTVKSNLRGPNRLNLHLLRHLRRVIPPHTALLLVLELAVTEEPITMEEPGVDYEESLSSFAGVQANESTAPADMTTESVRSRQLAGRCA